MTGRGVVNDRLEPLLQLRVRGPAGTEVEVEAVLDTGFDGALSLPIATVWALGLAWQRSGYARLADGSEVVVDIYDAEVWWDGAWRWAAVDAADADALLGMRLLYGSEVRLEVVEGGAVEIRRLA